MGGAVVVPSIAAFYNRRTWQDHLLAVFAMNTDLNFMGTITY